MPPIVRGGRGTAVLPPLTTVDADGGMAAGAPAPGTSVWLPMIYAEAPLGSTVALPMMRGRRRVAVLPPLATIDADEAIAAGAPEEAVTAGTPGMNVWLPIAYAVALLGRMVVPPAVRGGRESRVGCDFVGVATAVFWVLPRDTVCATMVGLEDGFVLGPSSVPASVPTIVERG